MNTLTSDDTDLTHHESPPSSVLADDPPTVLRPSEKANGIERQAVDFSPEILHPGTLEPPTTNHDGKPSSFELTALGSRPAGFYQKYGHEGKYAAGSPEAQNGTRPSGVRQDHDQRIPSLGLLLEGSQDSSEETDFSGTDHEGGSVTLAWAMHMLNYLVGSTDEEDIGDSTAATGLSNFDVGSERGLEMTRKRKREPSVESNAPATPASGSPFQPGLETSKDLTWCMEQGYFDLEASNDIADLMEDDVTVARHMYAGDDQGFIEIAQLVADQAIHQMEDSRNILNLTDEDDNCFSKTLHSTFALTHEIFSRTLPGVQQCDLKSFSELDLNAANYLSQKTISLQEDIEKRRQTPIQARGINNQNEVIFEAQVPYLSVQRGQDALDIAPPALCFWEELGLGPSQKRKDIEALCIYPDNPAIHGAASTFMTTLQDSYQSCKFGFHRPSPGPKNAQEGLLPVSITSTNLDVVVDSFGEVCEALGEYFSNDSGPIADVLSVRHGASVKGSGWY